MIREMLLISALMLLQTAAGVERFCRFNQADPCKAALGDKLSFQLVPNARDQELRLYKKFNNYLKEVILTVANNEDTKHESIRNRCEFILDNGTLIINTVTGADFGVYLLELHGEMDYKGFQVNVEGVEQICWFDQPDPCYAALGHKLYLPMVQHTRDLHLSLYKDYYGLSSITVFEVKVNKETKHESIRHRSEFISENGTLIITHISRADSGAYDLNDIVSDMVFSGELRVEVEAPIGSVQLSVNCSSSGVMRASCSSEGDQLLYSWTLNGDPLKDGNSSSIDLDGGTEGNIICSVKNHISHAHKSLSVTPCTMSSVSVVFVVFWSLQMTLLLGLLAGFHLYMRHTPGKNPEDENQRMSRSGEEDEDS